MIAADTNSEYEDSLAALGLKGIDHRDLSNEELHQILCAYNPEMIGFPVTEATRETVIAMIRVLGMKKG